MSKHKKNRRINRRSLKIFQNCVHDAQSWEYYCAQKKMSPRTRRCWNHWFHPSFLFFQNDVSFFFSFQDEVIGPPKLFFFSFNILQFIGGGYCYLKYLVFNVKKVTILSYFCFQINKKKGITKIHLISVCKKLRDIFKFCNGFGDNKLSRSFL